MCLISSPPLLPSDDKCSKKCPDSVTPITSKEAPPVLPLYNHQNGESCIIRTSVEEDSSGNIYKSILVSGGNIKTLLLCHKEHVLVSGRIYELVTDSLQLCLQLTNQEKAPAVIQRALEKHNLQCGSAEDYELVQIISEDKELAIPPKANVFYAMNTQANFHFILRRKAAAQEEPAPRRR
ncbi:hypothetical protein Q9233_004570 [Columba guinea]|nr:hypothetical protein Q9233_004570 [Columba guinea]